MATVRGLTAERMLQIEGASVVDGEVVDENLILTRHDGTTIDAGIVRGPQGAQGPAGLALASIPTTLIRDVGAANQIRAGRRLTLSDFLTLCGLPTTPVGLFNLGDLTNLGDGGALTNKGGAVTFGGGITGVASEAAVFEGLNTQALYRADSGVNDPFRIPMGSWGGWFRTAKRNGWTQLIGKSGIGAGTLGWSLFLDQTVLKAFVSVDGAVWAVEAMTGTSDVADNRWHFAVVTYDGTIARLYVDGVLDATKSATASGGPIFPSAAPLNLGNRGADASTASPEPHYGHLDEMFVTSDVLTKEQVRLLYAAKIAHNYGLVPKNVLVNLRRRRKGGALATTDFPAPPARLYNLTNLLDVGTNNVPLTANQGTGGISSGAGPDGSKANARSYRGAHAGDSGTDAGLPATVARTITAWVKTNVNANQVLVSYGSPSGEDGFTLRLNTGGVLTVDTYTTNRAFGGPALGDGQWHHCVVVYDPTPTDGLRFKLYVDGRLVDSQVAIAITTVLGGANRFRLGAMMDGTGPLAGQLSRVAVYAGAVTPENVRALFYKGTQQMGVAPKNPEGLVEAFDSQNVYAVFDSLESQHQIDLALTV